jgi:hypothetical protein
VVVGKSVDVDQTVAGAQRLLGYNVCGVWLVVCFVAYASV